MCGRALLCAGTGPASEGKRQCGWMVTSGLLPDRSEGRAVWGRGCVWGLGLRREGWARGVLGCLRVALIAVTFRFQPRGSPARVPAETQTTCSSTVSATWCGPRCPVTPGGRAWCLPTPSCTATPGSKVLAAGGRSPPCPHSAGQPCGPCPLRAVVRPGGAGRRGRVQVQPSPPPGPWPPCGHSVL